MCASPSAGAEQSLWPSALPAVPRHCPHPCPHPSPSLPSWGIPDKQQSPLHTRHRCFNPEPTLVTAWPKPLRAQELPAGQREWGQTGSVPHDGTGDASTAGLTSKSRSEYRNLFLWQGDRQEQGEETEKKRERSLQARVEAEQGLGAHASPNPCPAGGHRAHPTKGGMPRGEHGGNSCNPTRARVSWHTHPSPHACPRAPAPRSPPGTPLSWQSRARCGAWCGCAPTAPRPGSAAPWGAA